MIAVTELKQKAVRGAISYVLRTLVLQGIGFIAALLLGYFLSPAEFGVYFVVTAIVSLFTFMSDVGLAAALVQKKTEPSLLQLRTTFTVQQFLAVLIMLCIFLATPIWKTRGLDQQGLWLLYALAFSFSLASLKTIPSVLLERRLEFSKLVFPQILENLFFYVTVVVLAWRGYGIQSYTVGVLVRGVVGAVSIYMIQRWPIGFAWSYEAFQELLRFGAKFQLNDLLARIKDDLLIVVVAGLVGAQGMGYVSWAKRWSFFPYQLSVNSMLAILFPSFSRLQERKDLLQKAIEKSIFFISLIVFPMLVLMCGLASPALQLVPRYEKWLPALPSLYLFSFSIALGAISTPLTNTLNAIGQINKTLVLMLLWTILGWLLTPALVLVTGMNGVALASALIAPTSFVTIWMLKTVVKLRIMDALWRQTLAAVVTGIFLFMLTSVWQQSFVHLFVGLLGGSMTYLACLLLVGRKKLFTEVRSIRSS